MLSKTADQLKAIAIILVILLTIFSFFNYWRFNLLWQEYYGAPYEQDDISAIILLGVGIIFLIFLIPSQPLPDEVPVEQNE